MKKKLMSFVAVAASVLLSGGMAVNAQSGQPHSVKASVSFQDVTLSWQNPTDSILLKYHDDSSYDGTDGIKTNPEGMSKIYIANKYTAEDLKNYVGQTIDSISYFEYRNVYKANVIIYEDGEEVVNQAADLSGFEKNSWRSVKLSDPYVVPAGKELLFAICFEHGYNLDFVGSCDRSPVKGKGNLYSYDGKKWKANGPGDYMITLHFNNQATVEPDGYNVYCDGVKANEALITDVTEYTLTGLADGEHTFYVTAVYGADEKKSVELQATSSSIYGMIPPVGSISATVGEMSDTIAWTAPLACASEMTWSNKEFGLRIGGTASSNTKVWIKHEFTAEDLIAYPNHQITAVNSYLYNDGSITGVTVFIIKNGVIDYSEEVSADALAAIKMDSWNKFPLATPYKLENGNTYAYGLFYYHTPKMKPIAIDSSKAVDGKGNMFSTSSPSSKGFNQTKPSWKTLSSGNIPGNFMLTADVASLSDAVATPFEITGYDVYRDGEKIASDITELSYIDNLDDIGTYTYSVVAKSADGKVSSSKSVDATIALPAAYVAPVILDATQDGKNINISWSSSAYEMKHYGTASYMAGFAEEMPLLYGAKFSKEELAEYAGYKFHTIKFGIGEELENFALEIRTSDNEVLFTKSFVKGDVEPGYLYNINVDGGILIPADKDIYLAYNTTLPASVNAILLDAGPLAENGAMVSLTGGANWMKLGTIASELNDYNIVISALAVENSSAQTEKQKAVSIESSAFGGRAVEKLIVTPNINATPADDEYGVESSVRMAAPAKVAGKPTATAFRVYKNNSLVSEGASTEYSETFDSYGVNEYYVTAVYEKGWESAPTRTLSFSNTIRQSSQAPYDLQGVVDGANLNLTWKSVDQAPQLSYQTGDSNLALGMTGGTTREGYSAIKFPADQLADKLGQEISHISFMLNEVEGISFASVFVMYGDNIFFEQELDGVVSGWNTVRLNTPIAIEAGQDISVGYHIIYPTGLKPLMVDGGPAVAGYGDLISSSASAGFWYSLSTKYKQDYNYRMYATLKTPDVALNAPKRVAEESAVKYTVYCNGVAVATDLVDTSYSVVDALTGEYTVTATAAGADESAESNAVNYSGNSAVEDLNVDNAATVDGPVYGIDGRIVSPQLNGSNLPKGIYLHNGKKIVK